MCSAEHHDKLTVYVTIPPRDNITIVHCHITLYRMYEKDCTFFKNVPLGPRCDIRFFYIPNQSINQSIKQSKLGVSSSNQCNLHHSPHTGHLEKKIKKGFNLFRTPVLCTRSGGSLYKILRKKCRTENTLHNTSSSNYFFLRK